jgi:DNA-binding transcriptional ArsR family regulator
MGVIRASLHCRCLETLGGELRLQILQSLQQEGASSVNQLAERLDAERSRVSHALQDLRHCRFVEAEKKGRVVTYALNRKSPVFARDAVHAGNIFAILDSHARTCCAEHKACK